MDKAAVIVPALEKDVPGLWEAFAPATSLAQEVVAYVLSPSRDAAEKAAGFASRVVWARVPEGKAFIGRGAAVLLGDALAKEGVAAILLTSGGLGSSLAPRLAARLKGSVVSEATGVEEGSQGLTVTRPVYGGKAEAKILLKARPAVVTVKPGAFDAPEAQGKGNIQELSGSLEEEVQVLGREEVKAEGIPLNAAPVVVSGGRGVGGPEPFQNELKELADLLGGAVGASLAAVDAGWVSPALQVGQTGTAVSPQVYIAVGISGASQHVAGISSARHIVAINNSKDAPIFKVADVGVVGDFKTIIPALIKALKENG
ncbi:MAG: electron transfer flavoprotein subunit alpha/FixB family protein [Bacillota bacterium]|nr:electron transfer flavoprotein subunit alpha/FixB family protein [Bacillota bacterium]